MDGIEVPGVQLSEAEPGTYSIPALLERHGESLSAPELRRLLLSLSSEGHVDQDAAARVLSDHGGSKADLLRLIPRLVYVERRWGGLSWTERMQDPEYRALHDRWQDEWIDREIERQAAPMDALARQVSLNIQAVDVFHRALPHTLRGIKSVRSGSEGGKRKKGYRKPGVHPHTGEPIPAPPDEELASKVQELVDAGESITNARRRVGREYGIPLGTVRYRTEGL